MPAFQAYQSGSELLGQGLSGDFHLLFAFQMYTHFLGLDVSKATLDVALLSPTCQVLARTQLANTPTAFVRWLKALGKQVPCFALAATLACLEHTGLYCRSALTALD